MCKMLLPKTDTDKEDQTFILLVPILPSILKVTLMREEELCMLKILLNQVLEYLQGA